MTCLFAALLAAADPVIGRVLVLDLQASGVDAATAKNLTEVLAGVVRETLPAASVLGQSDIASMLALERQRDLLGCLDQPSCLAEIGGALGADHLLVGSVGKVGEVYVLSFKLLDSKRAEVVRHITQAAGADPGRLIELTRAWGGGLFDASLPPPETPADIERRRFSLRARGGLVWLLVVPGDDNETGATDGALAVNAGWTLDSGLGAHLHAGFTGVQVVKAERVTPQSPKNEASVAIVSFGAGASYVPKSRWLLAPSVTLAYASLSSALEGNYVGPQDFGLGAHGLLIEPGFDGAWAVSSWFDLGLRLAAPIVLTARGPLLCASAALTLGIP